MYLFTHILWSAVISEILQGNLITLLTHQTAEKEGGKKKKVSLRRYVCTEKGARQRERERE